MKNYRPLGMRLYTVIAAAIGMTVASAAAPAAYCATVPSLNINGKSVEMDTAPVLVGDTYMMPIRFLSEYLGCTVTWDAETQQAQITPPANQQAGQSSTGTTTLTVGQVAAVGEKGGERSLFRAPVLRDGRMFLPLKDIAGFLKAQIQFDPEKSVLTVRLPARRNAPEPVNAQYFARELV